jgi:hypothetical protein
MQPQTILRSTRGEVPTLDTRARCQVPILDGEHSQIKKTVLRHLVTKPLLVTRSLQFSEDAQSIRATDVGIVTNRHPPIKPWLAATKRPIRLVQRGLFIFKRKFEGTCGLCPVSSPSVESHFSSTYRKSINDDASLNAVSKVTRSNFKSEWANPTQTEAAR